jgi:hypothetical protein
MLGVLKKVLRGNNITAQDFSLGQGHIALVASLRILIAPGPVARAVRVPPLGAAVERAGRSGLARVHVDLQAILDGSLLGRHVKILSRGDQPARRQRIVFAAEQAPGVRLTIFGAVRSRRQPPTTL